MRSDFGRVVIEKERRGSRNKNAKARRFGVLVQEEDSVEYYGETKIPTGILAHSYDKKRGDKDFSDVLGPLNGYLLKSVGRKWDEVYSELSQKLGRFSWPLRHILVEHVNVDTNTFKDRLGRVWNHGKYGESLIGDRLNWRSSSEFYVDPSDRTLRITPAKPRYRKEPDDRPMVAAENGRHYVRIEGVWYLGRYRLSPYYSVVHHDGKYNPGPREVSAEWPDYAAGHKEGTWLFTKEKQCNKKELKDLQSKIKKGS